MPGDPAREGTGEGEVLSETQSKGRLPRLDWRRLGAEFLVIVVGVLVALGVDDWTQAKADRDFERHILQVMVTDARASADDLGNAVGSARTRGWCAQWILDELDDPAGPSDFDFGEPNPGLLRRVQEMSGARTDLGTCVTMTGYWQVFDYRDAGFTELQASGNLSVIRDPELRESIVRFHMNMADFQESNGIHRNTMFEVTRGLMDAGVTLGEWLPDDEIIRRLKSSTRVRTLMRHVVSRSRDQIVTYERTADACGAFRVQLEAALEDLP